MNALIGMESCHLTLKQNMSKPKLTLKQKMSKPIQQNLVLKAKLLSVVK
jgi:hypothetical protein